ncbi:MAG TPA: hypothetical protein DCE44_16045 [Verrucomicrobiales bacterium]|nr:hypothetical protein [Verrucomicrobiales bacterium]
MTGSTAPARLRAGVRTSKCAVPASAAVAALQFSAEIDRPADQDRPLSPKIQRGRASKDPVCSVFAKCSGGPSSRIAILSRKSGAGLHFLDARVNNYLSGNRDITRNVER